MKRLLVVLLAMTSASGCRTTPPAEPPPPEPGIALAMASVRAASIKDVSYALSFVIPPSPTEPVTGRTEITFTTDAAQALILDFAEGKRGAVQSVSKHSNGEKAEGKPLAYSVINGHIVIPREELAPGKNTIDIRFTAGDEALNRNPDFLYTLFVPAHAHQAFPCFDQPDIKARYTLDLTLPPGWEALANGKESSRETTEDRVRYAETAPIPTYLFAFAAGKFQIETAERGGRNYRMLHRETDAKKVARNRDAVFDLHASSLAWLERYTDIPYAFGKFDFIAIPSFQFSGMEHPGAVYYNASTLLLDESATENQMLNRATTIAHETAHMWFGDLVTMRWFNDVWMKEVFASFLAAKIVNPQYPKVNHDLRFLVSNYPAAYAVDRTAGTHAIRQELDNLNEAGSLYDEIIYDKAPIVMRQLERILGEDNLRDGLRDHLKQFQFGNATWLDLITVLDPKTDVDLAAWSRAWVEESGRPQIRTEIERESGRANRVAFIQSDPDAKRGLLWTQRMSVLVGAAGAVRTVPVELKGGRVDLAEAAVLPTPIDFVLPTGGGLAYGDFTLDDASRTFLLEHTPDLQDPVARGAVWITLWEELLGGRVRPADFVGRALSALPRETTEQNIQLLLGYLRNSFWLFSTPAERGALAPKLEQAFRAGIARSNASSMKSAYFSAFRAVATTPDGVAFLERVWRRGEKIPGLTLAEPDESAMAVDLAIRAVPNTAAILAEQLDRFKNPDRKKRFEYLLPALSTDKKVRDQFFESLKDVKNRAHETWASDGLYYINHPLRAADSERYVRPGLELLREIQRTGDIFFPGDWMSSLLGSRTSEQSARTVHAFLAEQKDYPVRLRRIILQSADNLFRAAAIQATQ